LTGRGHREATRRSLVQVGLLAAFCVAVYLLLRFAFPGVMS